MAIPFLDSEDGYQKTIDRILELEKKRLDTVTSTIESNEIRRATINEITSQITLVADFSKRLYGLGSAFRTLNVNSDGESIEGVAKDPSLLGNNVEIQVAQLATSHSIASRDVPHDIELRSTRIEFRFDEQEYIVEFAGGKLRDLAFALNAALSEQLDAKVIRKTSKKSVMVLKSKLEGHDGRIQLLSDSAGVLTRQLDFVKPNSPVKETLFGLDNFLKKAGEVNVAVSLEDDSTVLFTKSGKVDMPVDKIIDFVKKEGVSFYFEKKNLDDSNLQMPNPDDTQSIVENDSTQPSTNLAKEQNTDQQTPQTDLSNGNKDSSPLDDSPNTTAGNEKTTAGNEKSKTSPQTLPDASAQTQGLVQSQGERGERGGKRGKRGKSANRDPQ